MLLGSKVQIHQEGYSLGGDIIDMNVSREQFEGTALITLLKEIETVPWIKVPVPFDVVKAESHSGIVYDLDKTLSANSFGFIEGGKLGSIIAYIKPLGLRKKLALKLHQVGGLCLPFL